MERFIPMLKRWTVNGFIEKEKDGENEHFYKMRRLRFNALHIRGGEVSLAGGLLGRDQKDRPQMRRFLPPIPL